MKIYSIPLFLLLIVNSIAVGMDSNDNQHDHNENRNRPNSFWKRWNFDEKTKNMYKSLHNRALNASDILKNKYPNSFRFFEFNKPHNEVPVENSMKKIFFGTATDYEEVQVTFKKLVLPWYQKHAIRLAVATGAGGLLLGTIFGWKAKSFFSSKKKSSEE